MALASAAQDVESLDQQEAYRRSADEFEDVAAVGDGRDEPGALGNDAVAPADVALLALGRDHPKELRHLLGTGWDREEARTVRREGGIEGGLQSGAVVGHAVTPCSERRG